MGKHIQFIDSFQFMSSSLDKLSANLTQFFYTERETDGDCEILKKKGVYPYDYMDSFEKFSETELPSINDFYSVLNDTNISEDDYQHAKDVWNNFKIKNLGEYHDLYLKTDVLLLADVFENFRKACLKNYKLDPCHYMSSPGLSWDAMLKSTGIVLDLVSDIDMQLFVEKGLRGGISCISHRHGKANNNYMEDYKPEVESSYLMYLDANNLYGWAMSQPLPYGDFEWIDPDEVELFNYHDESEKGIILEVDLGYPEELHDLHNDYPCAPEKMIVPDHMLSDYCREIKNLHGNVSGKVPKLITSLRDKKKYVLHYSNLKLSMELGLKVTNVHRVLQFSQKKWLKPYISFNTELRKNAKNSFEKDFFQLMTNSVFGKTMENVRKRSNIKLATEEKQFLKLVAKPLFISHKYLMKI